MKRLFRSLALLPLFISLLFVQGVASSPGIAWQDKVEPQVLESAADGESEFIVFLDQQADLRAANGIDNKSARGVYVYEQLARTAQTAQAPILRSLDDRGIEYRAFWVANMIWVRGDTQTIETLARRPEVARIYNNPQVQLDVPPLNEQILDALQAAPADVTTVEWGISKVRAPEVWAAGYSGQGVVIGGQDTGYDWVHPALKGKYRGWDSITETASHDYNWHDSIHSGNSLDCGLDSPFPCDDHYHGTHTMGTMVGDDGAGNQIGMAPGAKWIGCRNMNHGVGSPASYSECYEWFIAPYPYGGNPFTDGDPSKAPHVINNSWSCPVSEGCTEPNILLTVVQNVRAAGILTVHSAGNSGSSCETVSTPAAIYDESFTVGSTDQNDIIDSFSSRGPVTVDGSNRLKPDVSAPGHDIRSSFPTRYPIIYNELDGTSMAAPHVAGLAALLISAQPSLAGQVNMTEAMITRNALPRTISQTCGGVPGTQIPNNSYGWGRIDAMASVENALAPFDIQKSTSATWLSPGETLTYTIEIAQNYPLEMTNVVISDVLPANVNFVGASAPYTLIGDTLLWDIPSLAVDSPHNVQMVVQAPGNGLWTIVNQDYGVHSVEASVITLGSPISVTVATDIQYFPIIFNSP